MPLKKVRNQIGDELVISVDFPGRILFAKVWEAKIGRVSVYFLDTDLQKNSLSDREITGKLYGGGKKTRIEQEVLLGIGGVKLLENELNIYPSVYHINEGHSAFLIVERLINFNLCNSFRTNTGSRSNLMAFCDLAHTCSLDLVP